MNKRLLKAKSGIRLDLGCGGNKQPGYVGMDIRKVDGVDIVHDVQKVPYPLPKECCHVVLMSHLWEHIEPKHRVNVMNEVWRIMKPEGQLLLSAPYYLSFGATQDPTHYPCPNEATFTYFDPNCPLYGIYKPKPYNIKHSAWQDNGNMELVLEKINEQG